MKVHKALGSDVLSECFTVNVFRVYDNFWVNFI